MGVVSYSPPVKMGNPTWYREEPEPLPCRFDDGGCAAVFLLPTEMFKKLELLPFLYRDASFFQNQPEQVSADVRPMGIGNP
jgi:hypothetical protein